MTYDQLRNAFGMRDTLLQRLSAFRSERLAKIAGRRAPVLLNNAPKIVVHIVPVRGVAGSISLNIADLYNKHDVFRIKDFSWSRRSNLEGLVRFPYRTEEPMKHYAQIFRNGAFEVVTSDQWEEGNRRAIPSAWAGKLLRYSLDAYKRGAQTIGIGGPVVVALSLISGAGTVLDTDDHDFSRNILEENLLEVPETWIDDSANIDLDAVSQPILDMFCQAYGERCCELFDEQGKWLRS